MSSPPSSPRHPPLGRLVGSFLHRVFFLRIFLTLLAKLVVQDGAPGRFVLVSHSKKRDQVVWDAMYRTRISGPHGAGLHSRDSGIGTPDSGGGCAPGDPPTIGTAGRGGGATDSSIEPSDSSGGATGNSSIGTAGRGGGAKGLQPRKTFQDGDSRSCETWEKFQGPGFRTVEVGVGLQQGAGVSIFEIIE